MQNCQETLNCTVISQLSLLHGFRDTNLICIQNHFLHFRTAQSKLSVYQELIILKLSPNFVFLFFESTHLIITRRDPLICRWVSLARIMMNDAQIRLYAVIFAICIAIILHCYEPCSCLCFRT